MQVLVPKRRIDWAHRLGEGALREIDESVAFVLRKPKAVFRGIRRDTDDDQGATDAWLCYCGIPPVRYRLDSPDTIPIRGRVLLVFVNREGVVYAHRWEASDLQEPALPEDRGEDRFKEKVL